MIYSTRCFRVDRVVRAVTNYVIASVGEKYVQPPVISFEAIFEQSNSMSPIVFILSPGSDPASDLMKLAERYFYLVFKICSIQRFMRLHS